MEVKIVQFPETSVAAIDHYGSPMSEHETVRKLVAWKLERRLIDPVRNRHYGIHFTNPDVPPEDHHVRFCLSVDQRVEADARGIREDTIPSHLCATARDIGSRHANQAAAYLLAHWLPTSGRSLANYPMFFHYVNVGPQVSAQDMVTDVYLPIL